MSGIVLEGVTKRFGDHLATDAIDLVIPDGAFTVFVGPSGCGKTTLLRLIAGLEDIDSGRLLIDGVDAAQTSPAARGLAMVFQSYALYPHMTVRANLGFALKVARRQRAEIAARTERVAQMLNLTQVLDRRPAALSGGQRQRVAIGRALVREPKAFLFDEPLSNLDAELRAQMRVEIRRLQQQLGITAIYVTHDQAEAMTMADRIVVFRDGRVEQAGSPGEIYRNPASRFVAGFIGSPRMNFLGGAAAAAHSAATIGVRPEHLAIDPAGTITATIRAVEYLGSDSFVHLQAQSGEALIARGAPEHDLRPDEIVKLRIAPAAIHRFDANDRAMPALTAACDTLQEIV
ncbi:MAG TPA: ABC transporter ATP-binding protein [Sphingopyxis sp.]|uniref:ABC transporter ATP-binding protein n=1 Tax=Sphingopyxis sp. TaxID=1908224 RepID=UPI002B7356AE|nr:ABC transporter ATP-binding protein [Sphingopyxis sp.]HWW56294.1 ABC transporter ATP-binding protein [Sphingopyxis sp.]